MNSLSPYLLLILAGFLPNEVWRMLGVVAARGLDEGSELVTWVRAVANALLAGVIAKIALFAPGALADVPLAVRLGAIALGLAAFLAARRSVFIGVAVGEVALMSAPWVWALTAALTLASAPRTDTCRQTDRVLGLERMPAVEIGHRLIVGKPLR